MTDTITPKTQEEWLEHFKELAKNHGDMLAQPFIDFFADKILLTKKEVEEARKNWFEVYGYDCAWGYSPDDEFCAEFAEKRAFCRLCKKLTQFVSQGDSEEKGGEDE